MKLNYIKKSAFSLIELAVVVLLIGLVTLVALNGKTLVIKANCVASSFGSKNVNDNLDNSTALTNNPNTTYDTCVNNAMGIATVNATQTFSPLSITGLKAWFDANDTATIFSDNSCTSLASSNSKVGCWKDKSTSASNVTQTNSAYQPTYQSSSGGYLSFSDSAQTSLDGSLSSFSGNQAHTIFVVYNITGVGGYGNLFRIGQPTSNGNISHIPYNGVNYCYYFYGNDLTGPAFGSNQKLILRLSYDSSTRYREIARDASLVKSDTAATGFNLTNNSLEIGHYRQRGASFAFNGQIYEVLFYNSRLSAADIKSVECYLGTKHSITVSGC